MKMILLFFISFPAFATSDPALVESKVQTDLEATLARLIAKEQYLLQVNSEVATVPERKLVESETTVQTPEAATVVVPPLPGFKSESVPTRAVAPQQSRQVFKTVDSSVLKSLDVQLTLDEDVGGERSEKVQTLVKHYLVANYGAKAHLSTHRMHLLPASVSRGDGVFGGTSFTALPWAIAALLASILAFSWFRNHSATQLRSRYADTAIETSSGRAVSPFAMAPSEKPKALALPSGSGQERPAFPALPATPEFVDQRSQLLKTFLANSEVFRLYFSRLGEAAQAELYAGLRGPAFDSLLEGLGHAIPKGGENGTPPSEEQMLFYEKNFSEFIEANQWQNNRFFGFLPQLTDDQLIALVKSENPMIAAIVLKFTAPRQSAVALESLTSKQRVEILAQSGSTGRVSTLELQSIEDAVRSRVAGLPKFLTGSTKADVDYWSKVLSQSDKQEELLMDLEQTRPELYPKLAKFRFKLEDAPSLPKPLLDKVLSDANNEELSLALLTCPSGVTDFLLNEISPQRRDLLLNQLAMCEGMPGERTAEARGKLTRRFREVMS